MARQARIVLPNTDHHISQRGIEGARIFFQKSDYQLYLDLLQQQCTHHKISVSSYCLLPNQIHLTAKPERTELLSRAIGETNRRYTREVNSRENREGNLFQNRFFSYPIDKPSFLRAIRFIETMPITLGIAPAPENYLWSSAKSRIKLTNNSLLNNDGVTLNSIHNWADYLSRPMDMDELKTIQTHLQTGRPRGTDMFLDNVENYIGRSVRPKKRGRKPIKNNKKQLRNTLSLGNDYPPNMTEKLHPLRYFYT